MGGVRLTDKQIAMLEYALKQTGANDEVWVENDVDVALCMCMVVNGLLSELLPCVFIITPAGRAWLERNKA